MSDSTPSPGATVEVTVDVPGGSDVGQVMLRTVHDGEAEWIEGRPDPGSAAAGSRSIATAVRWRFELPCHNSVVNYRFWVADRGRQRPRWLNGRGVIDHDPLDTDDFRLVTTGGTPPWVPETVFYQVFPDRFARSEHAPIHAIAAGRERGPDWLQPAGWDDPVASGPAAMHQVYGGDLDGIVERLDHVIDLGVGGLYLTPIFPGRSNHRYDAITFDHVDPLLGGDAALARLREACSRAGLRLVLDLTLNHTGDQHDWFRAAQADASSVEAGFYYFERHPDEYASWLGVRRLPKLNHASAELRRRFYEGPESVLATLLAEPYAIDGWRIDVANMTGRYGPVDINELVRRTARATVDAFGDRWLVGEHFFDATHDVHGDGWHGVMNYGGVAKPILSWLGEPRNLAMMSSGPGQDRRDGVAVAAAITAVNAAVPWQSTLGSMALLGSHDTARWRTMARRDDLARIGLGLLMTMPGSPCFFYGDEVGVRGDDLVQTRVPMSWDTARWDTGILDSYRSMTRMRTTERALAHGGFRWVVVASDELCFLRESIDDRLLIRATRADVEPRTFDLMTLDATALELVAGDDVATVDPNGRVVRFSGDGPAFSVWRLR